VADEENREATTICEPICEAKQGTQTEILTETSIKPAGKLEYACLSNHAIRDTQTLKHKCEGGALVADEALVATTTCEPICEAKQGTQTEKLTETSIKPAGKLEYVCMSNHAIRDTQTLKHKCEDGDLVADEENREATTICEPICDAVQGTNTEEITQTKIQPGRKLEYRCNADSTLADGKTLKHKCVGGSLVADEENKVATTTCNRKCTATEGINTQPITTLEYTHGQKVSYVCNPGHTNLQTTHLEGECKDGSFESTDKSKSFTTECKIDDPNIDAMFVMSHADGVDSCEDIQKQLGGSSTPPYSFANLIATSKTNYIKQYDFVKSFENNYVIPGADRSRFGVMQNDGNCDKDTPSLPYRSFANAADPNHAFSKILQFSPFQCNSEGFSWVATKCAWNHGFQHARSGVTHVMIYLTGPKKDTISDIIQQSNLMMIMNTPEKLKTKVFVVETRPESHPDYAESKAHWESVLDSTNKDSNKVWKGMFVGNTHQDINDILNNVRTFLKLLDG